jgi:hypothetical protein
LAYIFLVCADSVSCWGKNKLLTKFEAMTEHVDSYKDVFQKLRKECTQEQQVNFAMTADFVV